MEEINSKNIRRRSRPQAGYKPFSDKVFQQTIPDLFPEPVKKFPAKLALSDEENAMTYLELDEHSNSVAHLLREHFPTITKHNSATAGILCGRNVYAVSCMLGVMKSGGFFVILDAGLPESRIEFILQNAGTRILLHDNKNALKAKNIAQKLGIDSANIENHAGNTAPVQLETRLSPDHPVYIMYTSGSTGQPKGVLEIHRNLVNAMHQDIHNYYLTEMDKFAVTLTLAAGGVLVRMFEVLISGGSIHIHDINRIPLHELPGWMSRREISYLQWSPTLLRHVCKALIENANRTGEKSSNLPIPFTGLRLLHIGGEQVLSSDFELYKRVFEHGVEFNPGGGSTEAKWFGECFLDHGSQLGELGVPFGYPGLNKEIMIWDEKGNQLPAGQIGEIIVRSRYISPGYWKLPELTAEVFLTDAEDPSKKLVRTGDLGFLTEKGLLYHRGRKDHMVKVRGYRVELPAIEAAINALEGVEQSAVTVKINPDGDTRIYAGLVKSPGNIKTVSLVRNELQENLPGYMVPERMAFLEFLPLTPTKKTDRNAMIEWIDAARSGSELLNDTGSDLGDLITSTWCEILDLTSINMEDGFLEMGGNSILGMRVINRLNTLLGTSLTQKSLFETGTLGKFVELVQSEVKNQER
jgi:amino acid adenylation domain-containing protein